MILKGEITMIYGYVRVSTKQQKTERQIDNIKRYEPIANILTEKQSGKDIEGREVFKSLLKKVKKGDTIIFDEVSRMSRNATEGYELYMELFNKGIELIFLKEPHINTAEYKKRTEKHIQRVQSDSKKIDKLINGVLELIEEFEKDNLKDNIRLAFEQAEHERDFLIKRVTEGKAKSEVKQGRKVGTKNKTTEKEIEAKRKIKELSKDFNGNLSDARIMRDYLSIARNTYYKYKNELKEEK